jgi:hypothetical protein
MPPRYAADSLPQEQTLFLLGLICDHKTNRFIEAEFKEKFGVKLSKSALARWRKVAGDELADRAMLVKLQSAQMVEALGARPDADKFQLVMKGMQDHLLTAMSEVNRQSPAQLIIIHQEELRRKLRERELELKERALDLERERVHGVALDRAALGEEYAADLLEYIGEDPEGLRWFQRHAKPFQESLKKKYAATT